MKNIYKNIYRLHKVFGALFSIYYLNVLVALVAALVFNQGVYLLPSIVETVLLIAYFLFIGLQAYRNEQSRLYPILFLVMIGAILVFPNFAFSYLGFFFLITYGYLYRTRNLFTVPMSFIAFGFLLSRLGLLAPVGYGLVIYGWITYALKKPTSL